MKSIELGMAKKIDAVSTAPIHKGAIKLVRIKNLDIQRFTSTRCDKFAVCIDNVLVP